MEVENIDTELKVSWKKRKYFREALLTVKRSAILESGANWNVSEIKSFFSSHFIINIDEVSTTKADHIYNLMDECRSY